MYFLVAKQIFSLQGYIRFWPLDFNIKYYIKKKLFQFLAHLLISQTLNVVFLYYLFVLPNSVHLLSVYLFVWWSIRLFVCVSLFLN